MGWKNSFSIHLGFWLYLLAGGEIYFLIESSAYTQPSPNKPITINSTFCQHLGELAKTHLSSGIDGLLEHAHLSVLLAVVTDSCSNLTISFIPTDNGSGDVVWEYSSALFFCMTILTTIGYGNYSPKTDGGKLFCILYGFIGIPICGLFLASTTNYFSNIFLHLYEKEKKKYKDKRNSIVIAVLVFLFPGLAAFLLIPSAIFIVLEGWDYLDGVYFSFLSLTTVGFGDVVAAQQQSEFLWFYRICLIVWVTFGIAYWAIIIAFVMKALKSKELSKRWGKTSQAIAEQAKEMRRIMLERQISQNHLHNQDAFIALKTKAAVEFALKLTGSVGNLRSNIPDSPTLSVKTAAHSQDPEEGFITIKALPTVFNRQDEQPSDHLPNREQVEMFVENISPSRPSLTILRNTTHSMSKDSIFDRKSMSMSTDSGIEAFDRVDFTPRQMASPKSSRHLGILMRENSRSSLPPELPPTTLQQKENVPVAPVVSETRPEFHREWQVAKEVHGFWYHIESITRILTTILRHIPNPRKLYQSYRAPSARPTSPASPPHSIPSIPSTSPPLTDLLMEAIMILEEAELTGSNLTVDDE